ncbi:prominin isoform X1 [Olea europaea subsp. europaea]|uniref:Prominin isoform X1 n=1 Tax=Olea europaea subsp. europaea TaxID=158383 RepID=A0A8S0TMB7_OLEEU|nr:prominin isoform X1 [Olea europaea subsp. europaea]
MYTNYSNYLDAGGGGGPMASALLAARPSLGGYSSSSSAFARQYQQQQQSLIRPVQFRSVNLGSSSTQSANIRWSSAQEAVNFMDHLYFITNFALDYLLENELPQELMNQTLFNDPFTVLLEHRNELIKHFHKLLIAACTCLCIGISIPLFGFMIACCWCSSGSKNRTSAKRSSRTGHPLTSSSRPSSSGRHSRSRGHHRDSSDADWLALSARESSHLDRAGHYRPSSSARHHQDRRHRHSRNGHRRSGSNGGGSSSLSSNHRSRSVPPSLRYESSCHPCLRTFFSSNLFITLLLISFFVVCAFVTNEYVDNGVKQLPRALNQSVDEVQIYLNNTEYEVDNLFKVNYNQLEQEINLRLDTSGMIIKHKLAVASEAIALINLTDIVMEFNDTKFRLERIDKELSILKSRLYTAKKGLADFWNYIVKCPVEQCTFLRRKYTNQNDFRILPAYEKVPDVKHLIKKVNLLIDSGIIAQVQKGRDDFERFGTIIQRQVNGIVPELKAQLSVVGKRLSSVASDISDTIHWSDYFFNQTKTTTRKLNQYGDYEQYRRYACLGGATVILFILICYTFGWLYGSCRPQPTARTYKSRVKTSASASFPFSCGIFTVFLLFLPMILAAIVLFMTGSVGDKIVCRVIKHPEQKQSKQIYAMLQNKFLGSNLSISSADEDKVTIERVDGKELKVYRPNYADLIARCHQNQSVYKVLKLDQYDKVYLNDDGRGRKISIGFDRGFNLNSSPEFKRIVNLDGRLKDLIKQIQLDTLRVTLLSTQAEETLRQLANGLSFDDIELSFARLYDNGVTISPIDIEQLIKDFQTQRASISDLDIESELSFASIVASSLQEQVLPNITSSLLSLKEGVRHLKLRMFRGRNSFGTVTQELVAKIRSAEKQLRNDGATLFKMSANEFVDELNALVDQYAVHIRNQVENVIGQCEPVSRAFNSTSYALCDDIVLPFNGYWLSTIASLILILPATLLAYALKSLYSLARRGPHMQHNYSYTDQEDEISYEEDGEEIALAYHLGHHSHLAHKPSGSGALPSAPPVANDDGWSPTSPSYVHNSRPPPYAV